MGLLTLYVGVIALSGVIVTGLACAGWRKGDTISAHWFVLHMAIIAGWAFVAAGMLLVRDPATRRILERVMLSVSYLVPVTWWAFIVSYVGYSRLTDPLRVAVVSVVPGTFAVLIHAIPSLAHREVPPPVATVDGLTLVQSEVGLGTLAVAIHNYVLFFVGFVLLARMIYRNDDLFIGQATALLVGSLVPIVVAVVQITEIVPVEGLPITPAALSVAGVVYGYALFRQSFLDIVPAVRKVGEKHVLRNLSEAVVITDEQGRILQLNESAQATFDCTTAETLGITVDQFLADTAGLTVTEFPATFEYQSRTYAATSSVVEGAHGSSIGQAFVFRDITAREGHKQRLKVLDRVFRHNVRNNLTAIIGHAEMLAIRGRKYDAEFGEMADNIVEMSRDIVDISDKARTVEQMMTRDVRVEQVELNELFVDVVHTVRQQTGDCETTRDAPEEALIRTDPTLLRVVLRNVVENAVEHTEGRPTVEFTVDTTTSGREITIEDDGPGIPVNELDVIDAGTETQLDHGSGIGLWTITWGMQRLGGSVAFDYHAGGTRVTLQVPSFDTRSTEPPDNSETEQADSGLRADHPV